MKRIRRLYKIRNRTLITTVYDCNAMESDISTLARRVNVNMAYYLVLHIYRLLITSFVCVLAGAHITYIHLGKSR